MSDARKSLRPEISTIEITENFSAEEKFQNEVLRPILKLQHDLIWSCFDHHLRQNKVKIDELILSEKQALIDKLFQKDARLKTELRGIVIGMFTVEEHQTYRGMSSQLNRRMNNMLQQRISSCYE